MLSQHLLGAGLCLSCALAQQNTQLSFWILSVHLQSKSPHYFLLNFHDCLLDQCHPLPPLLTTLVCNGDTFTLLCSLGFGTFREGLSKEPLLVNAPHASCLGALQEQAVTPHTLQPADVSQGEHWSCK